MRRFACSCGTPVYFENDLCINCKSALGFDPVRSDMLTLADWGEGVYRDDLGNDYRYCTNADEFAVCNWLRPASDTNGLCFACRFNRTVPNQQHSENQRRWLALERAKKRLFYTLAQLNLPLINGWDDALRGLLFDFMESQRAEGPEAMYPETFVTTGYLGGIITINSLEADDAARAAVAEEMNESYRTVLGHMRHESGHYYWSLLDPDEALLADFRALFGDETEDYGAALERHYQQGAPKDWQDEYISAYASSHPAEDWAECWGHYLHIYDALDTAWAQQLLGVQPAVMTMGERLTAWSRISLMLNELNRSVGRGDAYPFVINEAVAEKLEFIETTIQRLRTLP